jgi:DNA-binding GntR family transcriptional regulator
VSGESLVSLLLATWLLVMGVVLVPAFRPRRLEKPSGPADGPVLVEDFVEAIARGDFEAAEHAAASVFETARRRVAPADRDRVLPSAP